MTTETAVVRAEEPSLTPFQVIEKVITAGDLNAMKPEERIAFYWRTCESLGLNPLTRPFEYISLNGKLTLYARKDATEQLRKVHRVTVTELRREKDPELGIYTVYAHGRDRDGREDEATGVVTTKGLSGEALANAIMKAETKAKRRLTLSLVGLGFLDESEIADASGQPVDVDPDTGAIREQPKPSLLEQVRKQQAALEATPADGEPAQSDVVDGVFTEPAPASPAPAPVPLRQVLVDTADAAPVEDQGTPVTAELRRAMNAVFAGLAPDVIVAGMVAAFGEGIRSEGGRVHLSVAQAAAIIAASSREGFAADWAAMAEEPATPAMPF